MGTQQTIDCERLEVRVMMAAQLFPARQFPIGVQPSTAPVMGDFNNDGKPDLAAVASSRIAIIHGDGDGGFASPVAVSSAASFTQSLATGDLNGDGKLDFVTCAAEFSASYAYVALNNGDGTYSQPTKFAVTSDPHYVTLADFNNDAKLDIVTADYGSAGNAKVSILLGNGLGSFGPASSLSTGSSPQHLTVADLNADGNRDLVVSNSGTTFVSVFVGNGNGTFAPRSDVAVASLANRSAASDFNADGKLDLAVSTATSVSILLGTGTGGFGPAVNYSTGNGTGGLALGDVDQDGKVDWLVTRYNGLSSVTMLYRGLGDGTFTPNVQYTGAFAGILADFNSDGWMDLASRTSIEWGKIQVVLGKPDGKFDAPASWSVAPAPYAGEMARGDVNGDHLADVVTIGDGTVSVLLAQSAGGFSVMPPVTIGPNLYTVATGDLNGDGKLDVVLGRSFPNTISVLISNGDGTFGAPIVRGVSDRAYSIVTGDYTGDGKTDVITTNFDADSYSIIRGNGDGTLQTPATFPTDDGPSALTAGDFNGDAKLDFAIAETNPARVLVVFGAANGTTSLQARAIAVAPKPIAIAYGEFNGDGEMDFAVACNDGNTFTPSSMSVLLSTGETTFTSAVNYPISEVDLATIAAGDFNCDGRSDLAVVSNARNNAAVFLCNADGTFQSPAFFSIGQIPSDAMAMDVNRDGRADLLVDGADITVSFSRAPVPLFATLAATGALTINAGVAGGGTLSLALRGDELLVSSATGTLTFGFAAVASIAFVGTASDDTLTLATPIDKPLTYNGGAGNDTLNVNGGSLIVSSDLGANTANLTINASLAANLTFGVSQHLAALNLGANVRVSLSAGGNKVLVTRALSAVTTARFDLNDNSLILDYEGAPGNPLATLQVLIATARNGGAWNGNGLTSSIAGENPLYNTTLGAIEAGDFKSVHGAGAFFAGEAIDTSAALVRYTYYGDTDFNGTVNFDDYSRTDAGFNNGASGWFNGDFNYSLAVNFDDYSLIDLAFNTQSAVLGEPLRGRAGIRRTGRQT